MTDRQKNINNTIFKEAVKKLPLKFPIAEISKKTSFSKGVVSNIINDKIPVSDNFLKIFAEAYGIDLKNDFDYAKVREHNESVLKENEAKRLAKLKYVGKGGGNRIYGPDKEVMMVSEPTATYGEDLVNKTNYKSKKSELIPYYDVDFIAGNSFETVESTKTFPDYMMDIPEFSGCVAFRAYSDSMNNLIKSGNILFATKVESWLEHLEFGQIYGVVFAFQ